MIRVSRDDLAHRGRGGIVIFARKKHANFSTTPTLGMNHAPFGVNDGVTAGQSFLVVAMKKRTVSCSEQTL